MKLKYLADNDFAELSGDALKEAITEYIKDKDEKAASLVGSMVTQGSTPRRLTDLIGSLADLTSGCEFSYRDRQQKDTPLFKKSQGLFQFGAK